MVRLFAEALRSAEVAQMCGGEHGARIPDRTNHRNGRRNRPRDTLVGSIDCRILKLRRGWYFPDFLLVPRKRSESALVDVIEERWVSGVSMLRARATII